MDGLVAVVVFVFVVSLVSFVFSVGATTVLSSHAPRSAALAKMQINFFIMFLDWLPVLDTAESNGAKFPVLPKRKFRRQLRR